MKTLSLTGMTLVHSAGRLVSKEKAESVWINLTFFSTLQRSQVTV